jgi:DNA-binding XRE family transcriptional regulator
MPDIRETPMEITAAKDLLIQEIRVMREHYKMLQEEAKYLNAFVERVYNLEEKQRTDRETIVFWEKELSTLRTDMNAEVMAIDTDIEMQRQTTLNNIEKSKVSIPYLWLCFTINSLLIIYLFYKG